MRKIATIRDVAKYTGLSIATISKYLNGGNVLEQNKELIEEAIKVLDYKINEIARGLKTNRTMTVGILIPSLENIFFTSIVSNIENILIQNGYSAILCDYREDEKLEKEKFDFLINKLVDGIVMVPSGKNIECIKGAIEKNIPIVLIDRMLKGISCDVVLTDNLNAAYDAAEQFIMRGHKKIGIISGPENIYTAQERLKGYLRVHEDYAMEVDRSLIKYGDYKIESGYKLLLELIDNNPRPTAVFVTNYEMTLGAIMAINERDIKVPEELSIIGFDNIQMAKIVKPPLSIVVQPMQQIGETAAEVLLKRLKGDRSNFPAIYRLKTEILLKESVSKLTG
ncbi:MAG: LacI family transcriptional regulator [Petroclostridium sp.]|uniref:LacI family DNA-binding transcriptional regulator n=1 Tax=Petroclostridium xylanilyticum TaxID=1792311 RepID=UPI001FA8D8FF|nr:LacI family DNA-binding transcriptional regulator [Petroclostridium xylanilyticum]MDK2809688.1 LacI family transcriptional regulator [Petroclostridium sp.]